MDLIELSVMPLISILSKESKIKFLKVDECFIIEISACVSIKKLHNLGLTSQYNLTKSENFWSIEKTLFVKFLLLNFDSETDLLPPMIDSGGNSRFPIQQT